MVHNPLKDLSVGDAELSRRILLRNFSQQAEPSRDTVPVLQGLIEACRRSEASFRVGAYSVQDGEFSTLLGNLAIQHCEFAQELQTVLERFGEFITNTNALRRGGGARETDDVKQDDCTILGECEAIDAVTFQKFSVAHEKNLPEPARGVIGNQYSVLKSAHEHLQRLVIVVFDSQPSAHSRQNAIPRSSA